MRTRPIIKGLSDPAKMGVRFTSLVVLSLGVLLMQNIGLVQSYQCYQCVYTNVTRYMREGLPINNAPAGKQMIPVAACSDTNSTIATSESDYVEINKDCPYGCAIIVFEFKGKKIVNRGCVSEAHLCGNYTVGQTSQSCCKGNLCNGGAYEKPRGGPYSCYQCVGSTSSSKDKAANVYNSRSMTVTKDCLDDSFDPKSPHVEVNHGCSGGCQSATMVPQNKSKNPIVMRGCASPRSLPCMSLTLNRDMLRRIAGMDKYNSMSQKCCNSPLCNAGSAVNFVTYNSSNFEQQPKYHVDKNDKTTTEKNVEKSQGKGLTQSVRASGGALFRGYSFIILCHFSLLTYVLSSAVS